MFLLVSGEGATDMGTEDELGPMARFVDQWIERRLQYSLVEADAVELIPETVLAVHSKQLKSLSKRGKKVPSETRFFYKNARALARLASQRHKDCGGDVVAVLFRDADGTVSAGRGEWNAKHDSILKGFEAETFDLGVAMVPKPKSEAWILCALEHRYQNCDQLEQSSGNDRSPNSLKKRLERLLGQPANRTLLMEKVESGQLEMSRIMMPSMVAFKKRCDAVLDLLGVSL
ncbi:hypothetical protein [Desulfoplanes sp.]